MSQYFTISQYCHSTMALEIPGTTEMLGALIEMDKSNLVFFLKGLLYTPKGTNNVTSHLIGRFVVPPARCRSVCPLYIFIIAEFLLYVKY
jgi:hypothetical protein